MCQPIGAQDLYEAFINWFPTFISLVRILKNQLECPIEILRVIPNVDPEGEDRIFLLATAYLGGCTVYSLSETQAQRYLYSFDGKWGLGCS